MAIPQVPTAEDALEDASFVLFNDFVRKLTGTELVPPEARI
jgi:hypothetical protein